MENETLKVRLTKAKITPSVKYSIGEVVDVKEVGGSLRLVKAPMIILEDDDYEAILSDDHINRFFKTIS